MRRAGLYSDDREGWGPDDPVFPSPWFHQANSRTAGFLGISHKFFDTGLIRTVMPAFTGYPTNGNMACVTTIGQGDLPYQRNGRVVTLTSLSVKGIVEAVESTALAVPPANSLFYFAVVLDRQTNGALALSQDVFTNILYNEAGPGNGEELVTALHRNLLSEPRFDILAERIIDTGQPPTSWNGATYASGATYSPFEVDLPLDLPVSFTAGTTQDIANVVDHSIHLMGFALQPAAGVAISWNCRVRFYG